jgi:hypothetical protein
MIGIVFEQYRGIAAVIILVPRLFGRAHPGWWLLASTAGGKCEGGKQDRQKGAHGVSFDFL